MQSDYQSLSLTLGPNNEQDGAYGRVFVHLWVDNEMHLIEFKENEPK